MFLALEKHKFIEAKIQRWLHTEPSVALLVAVVYFEWTVFRAILFISKRPNNEIRKDLAGVYGLSHYKDSWRNELKHLKELQNLPQIVTNWKAVTDAFESRNRLVHGRDRFTRNMALPHVGAILKATAEIREYCLQHGYDLERRMPVRRK